MRLLLLAGTAEARALADRLAGDARVEVTVSLAGVTRTPAAYAGRLRIGGLGGGTGLKTYLENNRIEVVVDATHPFARVMPHRARAAAIRLGLPCLRLLRPGWRAGPGDDWRFVADEAAVAAEIAEGARVFLATGRQSLPRFAALAEGRHLVARVIEAPEAPFPYPEGVWCVGRPPFSLEDEIRTLEDHRIDVLVAKDSGGPTVEKLAAARALGLPVVLIRRPLPPPGDLAETVDDACDWLESVL